MFLKGTVAGFSPLFKHIVKASAPWALTHLHLGGNFVILPIHPQGIHMSKLLLITPILTLLCCTATFAQPRSISNIVGESNITDEDELKIQKFAIGWAEKLLTTDADALERAHKKLISPFDETARMTPHGRSLYGKYLKEGFESLLSVDNDNEMAAVNALQVYSLLGTEQACSLLIKYAHSSAENRDALRLWASIGLGTTFLVGELPQNRVERYANLLHDYIANETVWYVLSRQFDSLAALQAIPGLDRDQRNEMTELSFSLQTSALEKLLASIDALEADERVQSLSLVLPSLRLQLNEPGINEQVKADTFNSIIPPLVVFVENAANNPLAHEDDLFDAYGRAVHSAGLLISMGLNVGGGVNVGELWNEENYSDILKLVESWKSNQ